MQNSKGKIQKVAQFTFFIFNFAFLISAYGQAGQTAVRVETKTGKVISPVAIDFSDISVSGIALGLTNGDRGDITVSLGGAALTVDSGAVAFSELAGTATWAQVSKSGSSLADLATRNFSDVQGKPSTLAGYGITDAVISRTATQLGLTQEVWLSVRTDGLAGTGTKTDPFDASTAAKFDALLDSFSNDILINLGPGTFLTKGSAAWTLGSNWHIRGAGIKLTTVKLDPAVGSLVFAGQALVVISGSYDINGNGSRVDDLTVDCNADNIVGAPLVNGKKNCAVSAITFYGNYNSAERVRAIGAYGNFETGRENFTFSSGGHTTYLGTFTANAGTDTLTLNNHGLSDGQTVVVASTGTLPAPLATNTLYYARNVTTNAFQLATSIGAAAIDITSSGTGAQNIWKKETPNFNVFNECIAENPASDADYLSGFLNFPSPSYGDDHRSHIGVGNNIVNCVVRNWTAPNHAIAFSGQHILGCEARNVLTAVRFEQPNHDILVSNCRFYQIKNVGVALQPSIVSRNVHISDTIFELDDSITYVWTGPIALLIQDGGGQVSTNINMTDCTVIRTHTGATVPAVVRNDSAVGVSLTNVKIEEGINVSNQAISSPSQWHFSNVRALDGTPVKAVGSTWMPLEVVNAEGDTISFTPTIVGWYRIAISALDGLTLARGTMAINYFTNGSDGALEFVYEMAGYGQVQSLFQTRAGAFVGGTRISQVRLSSTGDQSYLDIYVADVEAGKKVTITSKGPANRARLILAPVVGAVAGTDNTTTLTVKPGHVAATGKFISQTAVEAPSATFTTLTAPTAAFDTLTLTNKLAVTQGGTGASTADAALTNLGATTIGKGFLTAANPSAITFPRVNGNNTVTFQSASAHVANLGLAIGTDVQAYDPDLTSWAGITPATDVGTFLGSPSLANLKSAITDETTLGWNFLTLANPNAITFPRVNGNNTVTLQTASDHLANLGGMAKAANLSDVTDPAAARTNLGLVIGTDVQAYDADLTTWAGVTPAAGVGTFLGTPTLANLKSAITDETTAGWNFLTLANPGAVTFPRINADNSVTARSASGLLSDLGLGTTDTPVFNGSAITNVNVESNVYRVSATGSDITGTGLTWNTAFATITGALAANGGTTNNTNQAVIEVGVGTFAAPASTHEIKGVAGFIIRGRGSDLTKLTGIVGAPLFRFINCKRPVLEGFTYLPSADNTGGLVEYAANFSGGSFVGGVTPTKYVMQDVVIGSLAAYPNWVEYGVKFAVYHPASVTSGSAIVDCLDGNFTGADVGVAVTGPGIPGGTTVQSVTSSTRIVLSANATATSTACVITLGVIGSGGRAVPFNDANNDQALFSNVYWAGVITPVIIGHANSLLHKFVNCHFDRLGGIIENHGGSFTMTNCVVGGSTSYGWMFRNMAAVSTGQVYHHTSNVIGLQAESGDMGVAKFDSDALGVVGGNTVPISMSFTGCNIKSGGVQTGGADNNRIFDIQSADTNVRIDWTGGYLGAWNSGAIVYVSSPNSTITFSNCTADPQTWQWAGTLVLDSVTSWRTSSVLSPLTGGRVIKRGANSPLAFGNEVLNTLSSLGTTTTPAFQAVNNTAAANGAQQYSPSYRWTGYGWGTTASTSQSVEARMYMVPVQGTTPTGLLTLDSSINGGAFGNAFTFGTDGVFKPAASINVQGTGNVSVPAAQQFFWVNRSLLKSPADGQVSLLNQAGNDFTRLNFGGTTSSFPALKRSGTSLVLRLADDSADAPVQASTVISTSTVRLKGYTVATLPAGTVGDTAYVTDALAPTYNATVVGGGAIVVPVFYNGTVWTSH